MDGIKSLSASSGEGYSYIQEFLYEYGVVSRSQLSTLLARMGVPKNTRTTLVKKLSSFNAVDNSGERRIEIPNLHTFYTPMLNERVKCLWVLLDYIDKLDYHYRLDYAPSVIGMQLDGLDYEIIYIPEGKESESFRQIKGNRYELVKKMSLNQLKSFLGQQDREMAEHIRYIAVIEDKKQIKALHCEYIAMFAIIDSRNLVDYYVPEWCKEETTW